MKYSANKPDQSLLRLWTNRSGEVMDWLMDMTEAKGIKGNIFQFPPPSVDYPTMVPGISNGMALTFGRLAGLNTVNHEPS